jgi:hypothetical protein
VLLIAVTTTVRSLRIFSSPLDAKTNQFPATILADHPGVVQCWGLVKAYTLLHWSYPRDMRRLRAKQAAAEAAKEEQAV